MIIYVSDLGITKKNQYSGLHSKVDYVSYNERLNQSSIEKVSGVEKVASPDGKRSEVEKAREKYVIDSTPAYTIDFTSSGKVALKTFDLMKKNMIEQPSEDENTEAVQNAADETADVRDFQNEADLRTEDDGTDPTTDKAAPDRKTSGQKRNIDDGRRDMKQKAVLRQAISAYNYQMNFRMNYYGMN